MVASFRCVEHLAITCLDLGDSEPGSFTRHFGHCKSSLHLPYLSGDYSASVAFLQLFSHLEDLLIHTSELYGDDPTPQTAPPIWILASLLRLYLLPIRLASRRFIPAILICPNLQLRFLVQLSTEQPA